MQLCVTKTARAVTGGGRAAAVNSVTAASFHFTMSVAFCAHTSSSDSGRNRSSMVCVPKPAQESPLTMHELARPAHLQWGVLAGHVSHRDVWRCLLGACHYCLPAQF